MKSRFDSQQTALPYAAWVQALVQLVGKMLQDGETPAEVWKQRILDAADGYAQLMIDLLPRLESLIRRSGWKRRG